MYIKNEESDETFEIVDKIDWNCWLCLQPTNKSEYVLFNETHRDMLEILLKNNFNTSAHSFICNGCSNMLQESFAFKSSCLDTEDSLTPFINSTQSGTLDISMAFHQIHNSEKNLLLRNLNICRFCLKILENVSFTFLKDLSESELEMLRKVMPEMQLEAIREPIICETCLYCFQESFKFINICLTALKEYKDSSSANLSDLGTLSFSNVDIKNIVNMDISETDSQNSRNHDDFVYKREENEKIPNNQETECMMYYCDKCSYVTNRIKNIKLHRITHNKEKIHTCSECGFKTTQKMYLNIHIKRNHLKTERNPKKYSCELCPFETKGIKYLKQHQMTHQEPTQTFKCHICDFSSRYKYSLARHMNVHKGLEARIYKCDKCSYQASQKYVLIRHNLVHVKPDEAKLHHCHLCDFSTKNIRWFKSHLLEHRDQSEIEYFQCAKCDFRTKKKSSLRAHVVIHMDIFFKCELCSFKTRRKGKLSHHFRKNHEGNIKQEVCS